MEPEAGERDRAGPERQPEPAASVLGPQRQVGTAERGGQPGGTPDDVTVIEMPKHEAAERERDAPERAAGPPDPEHPAESVQAGRRQQVMGAPDQDERHVHRQQQQRQDVGRVEQADLAVRDHRVAGEDQRTPQWEPPRRQLLRQPDRQRIVERAGIALVPHDPWNHEPPEHAQQGDAGDAAACQLTPEPARASDDVRDDGKPGGRSEPGDSRREHSHHRSAAQHGYRPAAPSRSRRTIAANSSECKEIFIFSSCFSFSFR